jgi:hypothetical protein
MSSAFQINRYQTYIAATDTNISNPYDYIVRIANDRHLPVFKPSIMRAIKKT